MTAKSEIAERLRATLAKELKQDINAITSQHTLRDDLGLNSLDAIELMFKIEEEFDLSIPDEDMQRLVTVGDVVTYLEARTKGLPPAAASPAGGRSAGVKESPAPHSAKPVTPVRSPSSAKPSAARKKPQTKAARPSGKIKPKGSRRHA